MDSKHGTGSKPKRKAKKSTESFAGEGDVFASLNSLEESEHEKAHSSQVTNDDSEASASDLFFASAKRFRSSSFNSLSSSDIPSDDENSTQLNPKRVTFSSSTAGSPRDVHPLTKYTKLDLLPKHNNRPYTDAQVNSKVKPVTESPPVQMMERAPPGFDPNRIPESIFTSKPSGPTDWSVASNESLFSIRIGNTSFSKDHVVSVPKEVPQSAEADISKEMHEMGELGKTNERTLDSGNPPVEVAESESLEEYYEVESRISQLDEQTEDITIIGIIPGQAQNDPRKAKSATPEPSSKVNANANRAHVKQETTLKKKKSLDCCCSGCVCEFCCSVKLRCCFCKWPSCDCCQHLDCSNCCKWPNCCSFKCCKWPTFDNCCSCSKCCKWPSTDNCCSLRCCKWPSCSSCKGCKWPSCSSCKGCNWPSCNWNCKNCCKCPSCSCTNCFKCPSLNCFSSCSCTSCCSWPKGCCKWPSCSGCSFKWRYIFCCLPKTSRRNSRRSKRTCGWFSSIFCC